MQWIAVIIPFRNGLPLGGSGIMRRSFPDRHGVGLEAGTGSGVSERRTAGGEKNEKKRNAFEVPLKVILNCTPFVRQCDIMSNEWGDFYAKGSTEQTIHAGIQEAGRGNHAKGKTELSRNGSTI